MAGHNTHSTYGSVTKTFHWLTALLIFSVLPLGWIANDLAHELSAPGGMADEAKVALTATLFSLHKTVGVAIFFVALARILWAASQPKPGLLNGDNPPEAWLAETVHWLLYGSLVAVPLSGWIHHAATTGFAPIWWPFGQTLPFVPKDEGWAEVTETLHYVFQYVLIGALILHILGALKHHMVDRDATLRRMLPGYTPAHPTEAQPGHLLPAVTALAIWTAALGGAAGLGWFSHEMESTSTQDASAETTPSSEVGEGADEGGEVAEPAGTATVPAEDATGSEWQVADGTLGITVRQMGSEVEGGFADWDADIRYDEAPDETGKQGRVAVSIDTSSLTLGSVTGQAKGAGYLETEAHPTARFEADLMAREDGHVAVGTLTIRDQSVPVEMPFELTVDGDTATAQGGLSVDRRDFGIGLDTKDEGTLGFAVEIFFDLNATRQ